MEHTGKTRRPGGERGWMEGLRIDEWTRQEKYFRYEIIFRLPLLPQWYLSSYVDDSLKPSFFNDKKIFVDKVTRMFWFLSVRYFISRLFFMKITTKFILISTIHLEFQCSMVKIFKSFFFTLLGDRWCNHGSRSSSRVRFQSRIRFQSSRIEPLLSPSQQLHDGRRRSATQPHLHGDLRRRG